jgi:hypothetical protein
MCGRVIQSSAPFRLAIADGMDVRDSRFHNYPPHWNGAPSQELLVIRRNHHSGEMSLDPVRWGLIPHFCDDPKGGRKPINAKCETVGTLPTFRDAYRRRRCILPVDGFFEWKATKGKMKQPGGLSRCGPAIRSGLAGCGKTGRNRLPASGCEPSRSSPPMSLGAEIHNRTRYWYQRGVTTAIASTTPALAERCGALRHAMGPQSAHPHIQLLRFFALRWFAVSFRCVASNRVRMCGSDGRNRVRASTNCDAL